MDFTFDYLLPSVDFDEDSVVSLSGKDAQYRENGRLQTLTFGKSDVVLRIYDKVAEIEQQSDKVWLFQLCGVSRERLAHRVAGAQGNPASLRHPHLRRPVSTSQGDVLRYLATSTTRCG